MANCLKDIDFVLVGHPDFIRTKVMSTRPPYVVASPIYVEQKKTEEVESYMVQIANGLPIAKVPGYSIFLLPNGSLDGGRIPEDEMKSTLRGMAQFLLDASVTRHPSKTNDYKEDYVATNKPTRSQAHYYSELRKAKRAARMTEESEK